MWCGILIVNKWKEIGNNIMLNEKLIKLYLYWLGYFGKYYGKGEIVLFYFFYVF